MQHNLAAIATLLAVALLSPFPFQRPQKSTPSDAEPWICKMLRPRITVITDDKITSIFFSPSPHPFRSPKLFQQTYGILMKCLGGVTEVLLLVWILRVWGTEVHSSFFKSSWGHFKALRRVFTDVRFQDLSIDTRLLRGVEVWWEMTWNDCLHIQVPIACPQKYPNFPQAAVGSGARLTPVQQKAFAQLQRAKESWQCFSGSSTASC